MGGMIAASSACRTAANSWRIRGSAAYHVTFGNWMDKLLKPYPTSIAAPAALTA